MEQLKVNLRDEHDLFHPFFWGEETEVWVNDIEKEDMVVPYDPSSFLYEMFHYLGVEEAFKPWESKKSIEIILQQWPSYQTSLKVSFQTRDFQNLLPLMKKGISCCFSILFWQNNQPVNLKNWEHKTTLLYYKPINFIERMGFILSRPKLFHSFIQLSQLMEELTKTYHKSLILKNRKNV
ncbi:YpoC family protein [Peribacillus alkalitolerans]|uniref:YpoC family protein n=1 Tax=Peribacillus alkalitolerans TaxID=1550385 RepID=UPI0013D56713|nr:hypothetical protein [Peribacillus alkalitolerans]